MPILNTIFKYFGYIKKEQEPRGIVAISPTAETLGERPEVDYETLWRCYQQHPTTRACVDTFVKAAMSTGWGLRANSENPSQENYQKLMDFFESPNPQESFEEILEDLFKDIMIYGNAYIEAVRDENDVPRQLWTLDATKTRIKVDQHGTTLGFIQETSGKKVGFSPDEVLHFRLSTRGSSPYGLSYIETLSTSIQADIYAEMYNRKFFEQGAKVKKAYRMKNASDAEIKRNRAYLEELAKPVNAHKDLILEGDFEVIDVGVTPKDMEFLELRKFLRDQEFSVFGTPPALVSIIETAHLGAGTGETQLRLFFKGKVEPLQKKIAAKINHFLIKHGFKINDWRFYFEERIDRDLFTEARVYGIYLEHEVLTKKEVRTALGYSALKEVEPKEKKIEQGLVSPEVLKGADSKLLFLLSKRETALVKRYKRLFLNLIEEIADDFSKAEKKDKDWIEKNVSWDRLVERLLPTIVQAMNLGRGIARIKLDNNSLEYSPEARGAVVGALKIDLRSVTKYIKKFLENSEIEELKEFFSQRVDILARAEVSRAMNVVISNICS